MLDFRLQTFLCVCKYMNYTKAAAELGLTQPAVSQHIQYLQDQLGVPLFRYANRRLTLTPQGEYLKRSLETLQHDTLRIGQELRAIGQRQRVCLGATLSIGEFYLPPKLAALLAQHPELDFSVTVADTAVLLQKLDDGTLDFALCEGYFNKAEYDWQLIKKEALHGYCAPDYPLGPLPGIEALFPARLLLRESGSGTREILERYLFEQGYRLTSFPTRCEISSPSLILQLLLAGQGVSFLYDCVAQAPLAQGALRQLNIPNFAPAHEFTLVWKKNSMFLASYQALLPAFLP